ncbi:TPA: hypothetical protein ACTW6W_003717 [Raoultella ornithinolytica]
MTDITKLAQSLKAAAEKLDGAYWQTRKGFSGIEVIVKGSLEKRSGFTSFQRVAADLADTKTARAITLFSPANILALVEALEKAQRNANLTEAERQAYLGLISKRDERIAELESRTVKMPEPFKLAKSSSGLTYYYADEVNEALSAAGIKVEAE